MKRCSYCGFAVDESMRFCPNCGAPLVHSKDKNETTQENSNIQITTNNSNPPPKKRKRPSNIAIVAILAGILLLCTEIGRAFGFLAGLVLLPVAAVAWIICLIRKKSKRTWGVLALVSVALIIIAVIIPSPCEEHIWIEATCTEAKTCSQCGATEGESIAHIPGDWEVSEPATTTTTGEKVIRCTVCDTILETQLIDRVEETFQEEKTENQYQTDSPYPQCMVDDCSARGTKTYRNPFSGENEIYCTSHYQEMMDLIGDMEEDVGSGNYSKHSCEECSREANYNFIGLSGSMEYYCTEHYYEIVDMLKELGVL